MRIELDNQVKFTFDCTSSGLREFTELWASKYPAYKIDSIYMYGYQIVATLVEEAEI